MSTKELNWKGLVFWGLIIGAIILVLLYFIPWSNPIKTFLTAQFSKISFDSTILSSIKDLITKNWATIAGIGVTAVPLGYAYIKSYLNNKKVQKELELQQEIANTTKQSDALKISQLEQKLGVLEKDTTAGELQKSLMETKSYNTTLQGKIATLEGQLKESQKQPALLAESLWYKSGGQTIEVGGVKYRVIQKETVTVV